MLKSNSKNVRFCYERAFAAAQHADNAREAIDRQFWLYRERQWLKFATYYEHSERLTAFIKGMRSPPKQPVCSDCEVLMHVRRMQCRSDKSTEYHYECIHCGTKQTIAEMDAEPAR